MIYITNAAWIGQAYLPYAKINNPLVFYRSLLRPQDIVAPWPNPNRPPVNMWNPDSASIWSGQTTGRQYITLNNASGSFVDYIAIAAHNLWQFLYNVSVERSTDAGSTWSTLSGPYSITGSEPIVFFFPAQVVSTIFRLRIDRTNPAADPPMIAHIKMGRAFPLYRRIFSGFEPSLMKKSKTIQNGSDSGQYLGQVVIRSYRETSDLIQKNQPINFVRNEVIPFLRHCNGEPVVANTAASTFIIAWRPQRHPSELVYGWATDINYPKNETGNSQGGFMEWSISVGAIA